MSETPPEPVIPERADDDTDRALLDERPPHHEERE